MRDQSGPCERDPHELIVTACPPPEGPGSVSGAPHLPDGFTGTFTSRYVDTGDLRQHVVTGGDGPPLLLVHGWPQTWYAWRLVMPALARDFQVIAPDQRGTGLSGKPEDGYDTGTLAGDLAALMDALGPPAVRRGRPRHRHVDRLRPGRRPPGPGRPAGRRRDPPPGRVPVPAPVRQRAPEQRAVALRVQPARRGERPARHRPGRRSTSAGSSPPRPPGHCPTTRSGTTSTPSPPTPTRCTPASRSTARWTPPSRRTSSARPGG